MEEKKKQSLSWSEKQKLRTELDKYKKKSSELIQLRKETEETKSYQKWRLNYKMPKGDWTRVNMMY